MVHQERPHRVGPQRGQEARDSRRGSYAIIFALSMLTILAFAALAIDISYIRLSALQAQNAADAAAHAALVSYRSLLDEGDATSIAKELVARNVVAGRSVTLDPATDIAWGGWDFAETQPQFDPSAAYVNAVQVHIDRSDGTLDGAVDLLVSPIFGRNRANVGATAVGALRFRQVMLALDISPSMMDAPPADPNEAKWSEAQQAVIGFLDHMYRGGSPFPGDQLGLSVFVGDAVTFTRLDYVDQMYPSASSKWLNELNWCNQDYPPWPWVSGGTYYNPAPAMIDCSYPDDPNVDFRDSGTNHGAGIAESRQEILTSGNADEHAVKVIVLISDGRVQCRQGAPASCVANRSVYGEIQADGADGDNISIFTVSINPTGEVSQSMYLESLVRGFGTFYETLDETDVPGILQAIASQIPISLVQ